MKILILLAVFPVQVMAFSVGTQNLYHYNTRLDERVEHMRAELAKSDFPEIMGFQEAARWRSGAGLIDRFIDWTGWSGIYQVTNRLFIMNDGVALYSRFSSRDLKAAELPATKTFSRQFLLSGVFSTEIGDVAVVSLHFSPFSEGSEARVQQAQFTLRHIAENLRGLPVVIVGDLNDQYDKESLKVLRQAGFQDIWDGQGSTYVPGENPLITSNEFPASRLDFILYKPSELRFVGGRFLFKENWVSDHYGLMASFAKLD